MDFDRALYRISSLLAAFLLPSLPPPYPSAARAGGEKRQAFDVYNILPGWESLAGRLRGVPSTAGAGSQGIPAPQPAMAPAPASPTGDEQEDNVDGGETEGSEDLESGIGNASGSAATQISPHPAPPATPPAPPTLLTPPRPDTPYCCCCFPMTFNACSYLRNTFFLLAFFQALVIASMHSTYVVGGVNGNNWERDPITVSLTPIPANVNVTKDDIVSVAENLEIPIPKRTQPMTCLGATIASYSETNTHFLASKDSMLIKLSDGDLSWMEKVDLGAVYSTNDTSTLSTDQYLDFYSSYDYYFSPSKGVLDLPNKILFQDLHVFSLTISKSCLKSGWRRWELTGKGTGFEYKGSDGGGWASGLTEIVGYDVVMMNQVMFGVAAMPPEPPPSPRQTNYPTTLTSWLTGSTDGETDPSAYLHSSGHLMSLNSFEKWNYENGVNISAVTKVNFFWGLIIKLIYLTFTFMAFFFMSSFTAFAVRILTTSGVVIVFPILKCLNCTGVVSPASMQMIISSYPWIGLPITAHTNAARGLGIEQTYNSSIVWPHAFKLIVYYSLYSLAQSGISYGTYEEPYSYTMPVGVWGILMIWEYYSMVIIRGVEGIVFFPKFCLLMFTAFHMYFHCFVYPYSDLAVMPMFFASLGAMVYTFMVLEIPKHREGILTDERPREIWNALAWGEWGGSLPQEFTMFMTLNARYRPIGVDEDDDDDDDNNVDEDEGGPEAGEEEGDEEEGRHEGDQMHLLESEREEDDGVEMMPLSNNRPGITRRRDAS